MLVYRNPWNQKCSRYAHGKQCSVGPRSEDVEKMLKARSSVPIDAQAPNILSMHTIELNCNIQDEKYIVDVWVDGRKHDNQEGNQLKLSHTSAAPILVAFTWAQNARPPSRVDVEYTTMIGNISAKYSYTSNDLISVKQEEVRSIATPSLRGHPLIEMLKVTDVVKYLKQTNGTQNVLDNRPTLCTREPGEDYPLKPTRMTPWMAITEMKTWCVKLEDALADVNKKVFEAEYAASLIDPGLLDFDTLIGPNPTRPIAAKVGSSLKGAMYVCDLLAQTLSADAPHDIQHMLEIDDFLAEMVDIGGPEPSRTGRPRSRSRDKLSGSRDGDGGGGSRSRSRSSSRPTQPETSLGDGGSEAASGSSPPRWVRPVERYIEVLQGLAELLEERPFTNGEALAAWAAIDDTVGNWIYTQLHPPPGDWAMTSEWLKEYYKEEYGRLFELLRVKDKAWADSYYELGDNIDKVTFVHFVQQVVAAAGKITGQKRRLSDAQEGDEKRQNTNEYTDVNADDTSQIEIDADNADQVGQKKRPLQEEEESIDRFKRVRDGDGGLGQPTPPPSPPPSPSPSTPPSLPVPTSQNSDKQYSCSEGSIKDLLEDVLGQFTTFRASWEGPLNPPLHISTRLPFLPAKNFGREELMQIQNALVQCYEKALNVANTPLKSLKCFKRLVEEYPRLQLTYIYKLNSETGNLRTSMEKLILFFTEAMQVYNKTVVQTNGAEAGSPQTSAAMDAAAVDNWLAKHISGLIQNATSTINELQEKLDKSLPSDLSYFWKMYDRIVGEVKEKNSDLSYVIDYLALADPPSDQNGSSFDRMVQKAIGIFDTIADLVRPENQLIKEIVQFAVKYCETQFEDTDSLDTEQAANIQQAVIDLLKSRYNDLAQLVVNGRNPVDDILRVFQLVNQRALAELSQLAADGLFGSTIELTSEKLRTDLQAGLDAGLDVVLQVQGLPSDYAFPSLCGEQPLPLTKENIIKIYDRARRVQETYLPFYTITKEAVSKAFASARRDYREPSNVDSVLASYMATITQLFPHFTSNWKLKESDKVSTDVVDTLERGLTSAYKRPTNTETLVSEPSPFEVQYDGFRSRLWSVTAYMATARVVGDGQFVCQKLRSIKQGLSSIQGEEKDLSGELDAFDKEIDALKDANDTNESTAAKADGADQMDIVAEDADQMDIVSIDEQIRELQEELQQEATKRREKLQEESQNRLDYALNSMDVDLFEDEDTSDFDDRVAELEGRRTTLSLEIEKRRDEREKCRKEYEKHISKYDLNSTLTRSHVDEYKRLGKHTRLDGKELPKSVFDDLKGELGLQNDNRVELYTQCDHTDNGTDAYLPQFFKRLDELSGDKTQGVEGLRRVRDLSKKLLKMEQKLKAKLKRKAKLDYDIQLQKLEHEHRGIQLKRLTIARDGARIAEERARQTLQRMKDRIRKLEDREAQRKSFIDLAQKELEGARYQVGNAEKHLELATSKHKKLEDSLRKAEKKLQEANEAYNRIKGRNMDVESMEEDGRMAATAELTKGYIARFREYAKRAEELNNQREVILGLFKEISSRHKDKLDRWDVLKRRVMQVAKPEDRLTPPYPHAPKAEVSLINNLRTKAAQVLKEWTELDELSEAVEHFLVYEPSTPASDKAIQKIITIRTSPDRTTPDALFNQPTGSPGLLFKINKLHKRFDTKSDSVNRLRKKLDAYGKKRLDAWDAISRNTSALNKVKTLVEYAEAKITEQAKKLEEKNGLILSKERELGKSIDKEAAKKEEHRKTIDNANTRVEKVEEKLKEAKDDGEVDGPLIKRRKKAEEDLKKYEAEPKADQGEVEHLRTCVEQNVANTDAEEARDEFCKLLDETKDYITHFHSNIVEAVIESFTLLNYLRAKKDVSELLGWSMDERSYGQLSISLHWGDESSDNYTITDVPSEGVVTENDIWPYNSFIDDSEQPSAPCDGLHRLRTKVEMVCTKLRVASSTLENQHATDTNVQTSVRDDEHIEYLVARPAHKEVQMEKEAADSSFSERTWMENSAEDKQRVASMRRTLTKELNELHSYVHNAIREACPYGVLRRITSSTPKLDSTELWRPPVSGAYEARSYALTGVPPRVVQTLATMNATGALYDAKRQPPWLVDASTCASLMALSDIFVAELLLVRTSMPFKRLTDGGKQESASLEAYELTTHSTAATRAKRSMNEAAEFILHWLGNARPDHAMPLQIENEVLADSCRGAVALRCLAHSAIWMSKAHTPIDKQQWTPSDATNIRSYAQQLKRAATAAPIDGGLLVLPFVSAQSMRLARRDALATANPNPMRTLNDVRCALTRSDTYDADTFNVHFRTAVQALVRGRALKEAFRLEDEWLEWMKDVQRERFGLLATDMGVIDKALEQAWAHRDVRVSALTSKPSTKAAQQLIRRLSTEVWQQRRVLVGDELDSPRESPRAIFDAPYGRAPIGAPAQGASMTALAETTIDLSRLERILQGQDLPEAFIQGGCHQLVLPDTSRSDHRAQERCRDPELIELFHSATSVRVGVVPISFGNDRSETVRSLLFNTERLAQAASCAATFSNFNVLVMNFGASMEEQTSTAICAVANLLLETWHGREFAHIHIAKNNERSLRDNLQHMISSGVRCVTLMEVLCCLTTLSSDEQHPVDRPSSPDRQL